MLFNSFCLYSITTRSVYLIYKLTKQFSRLCLSGCSFNIRYKEARQRKPILALNIRLIQGVILFKAAIGMFPLFLLRHACHESPHESDKQIVKISLLALQVASFSSPLSLFLCSSPYLAFFCESHHYRRRTYSR